ncbi:MAG: glycosyltransferase family 9 protein [Planctomycetota bacterium]|jgi:heptosyltransferase-2
MSTTQILILKTGALGDVLRTTSILPGLRQRYGSTAVTWLTAPAARDLVRLHPLVDTVLAAKPDDTAALGDLGASLAATAFDRVISLDDEEPLCALATRLADPAARPGVLSGAYFGPDGQRAYTDDVSPWFDMGLLSRFGKQRADELKVANQRSHAAIYAEMLGIEMGEPELPLDAHAEAFGREFHGRLAAEHGARTWIGLNTGSGGRWESKKLSVERTVELSAGVAAGRSEPVGFVVLGGPEERERNGQLVAGLRARGLAAVDGGTENSLLEFAGLVDGLALLVTSDSLALHVAVARRVPVMSFFAPTSAAEIELYGRGAKVQSTAPDYCSYKKDADTSTLTVERLLGPTLALLDRS